jgi:hypothetical protein
MGSKLHYSLKYFDSKKRVEIKISVYSSPVWGEREGFFKK